MLYRIGKLLFSLLIRYFLKLEVKGKDAFPLQDTPFLFAANHLSYLDPVVLGVVCPYPVGFLAKEELFRNKSFAFLLHRVGAIPLRRSASDIGAVKAALKTLQRKPLVIFPQGTRRQGYGQINEGVGLLCKKAGVGVVAAKIYGTDKALPKGAKFLRRNKICVVIERVTNIKEDDTYQEITKKVIEKIKSL